VSCLAQPPHLEMPAYPKGRQNRGERDRHTHRCRLTWTQVDMDASSEAGESERKAGESEREAGERERKAGESESQAGESESQAGENKSCHQAQRAKST